MPCQGGVYLDFEEGFFSFYGHTVVDYLPLLHRRLQMKKLFVPFLVVFILFLVGCDTASPEEEAITGIWKRVGGAESYCRYKDDGTYGCGFTLESVERDSAAFNGEYWFEEGRYIDKIDFCSEDGVYELNFQSNGNLKYELIEDDCATRVSAYIGGGNSAGTIEYEPIP
jgi:hypothetical protein